MPCAAIGRNRVATHPTMIPALEARGVRWSATSRLPGVAFGTEWNRARDLYAAGGPGPPFGSGERP
jgi:hypothetical protein